MNILVAMPAGIARDTFIPPQTAEILESMGNVIWNNSTDKFSEEELKEKIKDIDVCITGWAWGRFNLEILENAERFRLVAHTGGTVAGIVSDYFYDRGIKVISGNWIYAESVAEGVIAYILASLRDIPYYANQMQAGRWKSASNYNEGLLDQTIGLVGFGTVTKYLVKLLEPFRLKIKVYSKHIMDETLSEYGIERASLENIFSTCKIVSIHSAQRPDTYHMIDKKLLELLPDGSLLVNTARGSIIDENALCEELKKNRFKAILDVYETEPLPADSKLRGLRNVILIPHMAGPTIDRRKTVTIELIKDIKNYFNGGELKYEISKSYAMVMTQ